MQLNDQVFSIDRDRYTASGGTAPLDLMLNLIQLQHGLRISQRVSEQFVLERVRSDRDRQYVPLRAQVGSSHGNMIRVAQLMEENIEGIDAYLALTGDDEDNIIACLLAKRLGADKAVALILKALIDNMGYRAFEQSAYESNLRARNLVTPTAQPSAASAAPASPDRLRMSCGANRSADEGADGNPEED